MCPAPLRAVRPRPSIVALFLLLASLPLLAETGALGIRDAMRLAAADAPQLIAQVARSRAAREDAARAGALPDPSLTLAIDNLPIDGSDALSLGADMMTMRRIGLMQEWPSRRKRDARRAAANAAVDESLAGEAAMQAGVEREAALAWLARWSSERQLQLLDALEDEARRAADVAEARLSGGDGSTLQALAARQQAAELETRRIALAAEREAAIAALARWIGAAATMPLATDPDFGSLPVPIERLRTALDRHAPVQLAAARSARAERGIALAEADKRPDLSFGVGYGFRSGRDDMLMLEIGIGLPLFAAGRQDRDVAARRAEFDAAIAELDDARRLQRAQLERVIAEWQGLQRSDSHYRERLLPLARDRSALALAAYSAGGALQPLLDARAEEIELRMRHVEISAALGSRWAQLATLLVEDAR